MRLLLDTHAFLWWDGDAERLPHRLRSMLEDPGNEITLSVVSVWEMQIKAGLGRLTLRRGLRSLISEQRERNRIRILPVTLPHVLALDELGNHHKDPFDRLLIAQARTEGLTLASRDKEFRQYDVPLVWDS